MRENIDPKLFEPNPGIHNCNPREIGFWELIREDFRTHESRFFSQGFWALFWHRFGNWRMDIKLSIVGFPIGLIYKFMYGMSQIICGIMLPYTTRVGRRVKLEHFGGMILVAQTIGDDVIIRQNTTFGIAGLRDLQARPVIGNGVEIGAGVVIIGNTYIGDNTIIGANAVVTRDTPRNSVVAGVPAVVLARRKT